jgi:hypothetical protein
MMAISLKDLLTRWGRKETVLLIAALCIITVILLLPFSIKWVLEEKVLNKYLESAEMEDVDFNPFTGRISVKGVQLMQEGKVVLDTERLVIDLEWCPLLKKRIKMKSLLLQNATVHIHRSASNVWEIAGIAIPLKLEEHPVSGERSWGLGLVNSELKNIRIIYSDPMMLKEILVVKAHLDTVESWANERPSGLSVRLVSDGAVIEMNGEVKPFSSIPSIVVDTRVENLNISWFSPILKGTDFSNLSGIVNSNIKLQTIFNSKEDALRIKLDGALSLKGLDGHLDHGKQSIYIRQDTLRTDGSLSYDRTGINGTINLSSKGLRVVHEGKRLDLFSLEELDLSGVTIKGQDMVQADKVRLTDARFLGRLPEEGKVRNEPSHIFSAKDIILARVGLRNMNSIEIDSAMFKGVTSWFARGRNEKFELLQWLGKGKISSERSVNDTQRKKFSISIRKTTIQKDSRIVFRDSSVKPRFMISLSPFEAHLGQIDSRFPGRITDITAKTRIGKYSTLQVSGKMQFFAEKPSINIEGKLETFNLLELRPYLEQRFAYLPKSGQLDANIHWRQTGSILDGEIFLFIRKLKVERVNYDKEDITARILGVPLESALNTLRDRNDIIRIRVPITGNLQDPEFRLYDVMRVGLVNAIKEGALSYFAPLGVQLIAGITLLPGTLYAAKKLLEFGTTLRLNPVSFRPLSNNLDQDARKYLSEIAALLKDRPKVSVVLCGIATLSDLRKLQGYETFDLSTKNEETRTDSAAVDLALPKAAKEQLEQLAQRRANIVKDYLIKTGSVEAERLILCSPEIQLKEAATPRVEIGV